MDADTDAAGPTPAPLHSRGREETGRGGAGRGLATHPREGRASATRKPQSATRTAKSRSGARVRGSPGGPQPGATRSSARTARPRRSAPSCAAGDRSRRGPKRGPTNTAPRALPAAAPEHRGLGLGPSPGRADASTRRWDTSPQRHAHSDAQEPQNNCAEWKRPDQKNTRREKCHLYKAPETQTHLQSPRLHGAGGQEGGIQVGDRDTRRCRTGSSP